MKIQAYPDSKSPTARLAFWRVEDDAGDAIATGSVLLSTAKRARALHRLLAHLEKQYPDARRWEAHFPDVEMYRGLEAEQEAA